MTYKDTLFFVAQCLTISLEKKNRILIEEKLQAGNIDLEAVVKVSTSHYVLPALYCNLKRVVFLNYLPEDLVAYMKHITELNHERNHQIIEQARELNELLIANDIIPVFLKGTGNLLEGLYDDIAERMVGDIDFLFSGKDFFKAIDILKSDNYSKPDNELNYFPGFRHYSRLVKHENIAAVEIHKEVTLEKYKDEFSCSMIIEDVHQINDFAVLSFENKLSLSIIASQVNDYGFEFNKFSLRNAYDVFLLSNIVDTKNVISKFAKLKKPLNCFLSKCNLVFGDLESLKYHKTKESETYLKAFNKSLYKKESNLKINFKLMYINLNRRFSIVCKSMFNNENRKWLLNRIKSRINN